MMERFLMSLLLSCALIMTKCAYKGVHWLLFADTWLGKGNGFVLLLIASWGILTSLPRLIQYIKDEIKEM